MQKKVLIISAPFFGYEKSISRAFVYYGCQVQMATYDEPVHPFRGILKWQHKFSWNKEALKQKSREKYAQHIRSVFDEYRPDIVFVFDGRILLPDTLAYFHQTAKIVLWMYDSLQNPLYARCEKLYEHTDAFFCFEKSDVDYLAAKNKKAYFLPLACDTDVYFPIQNEKNIDILFVGAIYHSARRKRILRRIVREFPNAKILIYGMYKPYYKNPITWLFREKRHVFKNKNISPSKVNELFSRTKVALNIHHKQTKDGANQRVFETSGSGAYQICDANPYIENLFPNGEVGLYKNEEELIRLIQDALQNDRSAHAEAAKQIILSGQTFKHRVDTILKMLKMN